MPQITIDPGSRPDAVETVSLTPVPGAARRYGFVPDLRHCRAGDLILSRSVSPSWLDKQIVRAQTQAGFSPADSCWTHAAMFLYEDFILEAVPRKGVITRSLYEDIPTSVLRVRRRPDLKDEERYKIALCAQKMLGTRYGVGAALSLGWTSIVTGGLWNRDWRPLFRSAVICSQVVYDAHAEITRKMLKGCLVNRDVMPAHLSATSDLEDISVPWVKLS
jgi:hypothetical protein